MLVQFWVITLGYCMKKLKVKLITLGHITPLFNAWKIENWKSDIFEIVDVIENYNLNANSDGPNWEFSDKTFMDAVPEKGDADFIIAVTSVPLELNWFVRRIGDDKIIFSFHETKDILIQNNIPIENAILRMIYAYSLVYLSSEQKIPSSTAITNFTHDENRGCLFDMDGIKTDIITSCHNPILCDSCIEKYRSAKISNSVLKIVQKEIKKIKKNLFYRITHAVKRHPILALFISSIFAIILGTIGSVLGSILFEKYLFNLIINHH